MKRQWVYVMAILAAGLSGTPWAACPSMDFTGDCTVDLADLAMFAAQWMTVGTTQPNITWITINDSGAGMKDINGNPLSWGGFVGQMSVYETTNAQFCEFLNALFDDDLIFVFNNYVYARTDTGMMYPYYHLAGPGYTHNGATNGGAARIHLSHKQFVVDSGFENHPVTYVSLLGAKAFCDYFGWRLPTEWEWQAVADYDGTFIYSCGIAGTTISNTYANYFNSSHPDGTNPVGTFGASGYQFCNMAGNVAEWTGSPLDPQQMHMNEYVTRGGSWDLNGIFCHVANRDWYYDLRAMTWNVGFRVCR